LRKVINCFKDKALVWLVLANMFAFGSEAQLGRNVSQYLSLQNGEEGIRLFSFLMTINTLLVVVLQPVYVETLAKKLSNVKGFLFGGLIMAFSCFAYAFADRAPMWFGIMAVYTIGEVLQNPKFSGLAAQTAKQGDPSLYYSIIGTAGSGGVALMPFIGGMLLVVHYSLLFLFMGGLLLLAMVCLICADRNLQRNVRLNGEKARDAEANG
jgi:MFS family permease